MKQLLSIFFILSSFIIYAEDEKAIELKDTVWQLAKNGSNNRFHGQGQVVYFMAGDAYRTWQARQSQDWDQFAMTDSRDLERLIKGDAIKIVATKFNNKVLEIQLLSGPEKNKTFFLIKEELLKNFLLMENGIETT